MRDWLKLIVLILLPVNAWLATTVYLRWQKQKFLEESRRREFTGKEAVHRFLREEILGLKEGHRLRYPFPYPSQLLGPPPPIGQGIAVLLLNLSTRADKEIWDSAIKEALEASSSLHILLLYERRQGSEKLSKIQELLREFPSSRLSAVIGERWVREVFGQGFLGGGVLLVLCDGQGVIRVIVPYPERKEFKTWEDESAYWRTKLHKAVKKVVDEFFPREKGR
jgi:hypothetical protein